MKNLLLVGGGKIGVAITEFLRQSGDYRITVADRDPGSLGRMPPADNVTLRELDILSRDFFDARPQFVLDGSLRRALVFHEPLRQGEARNARCRDPQSSE